MGKILVGKESDFTKQEPPKDLLSEADLKIESVLKLLLQKNIITEQEKKEILKEK